MIDDQEPPPDLRRYRRPKQNRAAEPHGIESLPPHSVEAEMGLIGSILIDPLPVLEAVAEARMVSEWLYDLRHKTLFETFDKMALANVPIDLVTVVQRLKDNNLLEAIGNLAYLASLQDAVASTANVTHYIEIVREKFSLRKAIQVCTNLVTQIYENEGNATEILGQVEHDILAIRASTEAGRGVSDTGLVLDRLRERIEAAMRGEPQTGIRTGLMDLDRKIGGLRPQQVLYLAATPGAGKTSIAMNIAAHAIFREEVSVGVFSLETSAEDIMHMLVTAQAQVNGKHVNEGAADMVENERYTASFAALTLKKEFLHVCDDGGLSMDQIRSKARRMHKAGVRLFILDYIQLVIEDGATPTERLSAASIGCKNMAKELDCPLIVISALSNDVLKEGKRPSMGDLKQSGQMSYDANIIALMHCKEPEKTVRKVEVNIVKNKGGQTGTLTLSMFPEQYRFANYSDADEE